MKKQKSKLKLSLHTASREGKKEVVDALLGDQRIDPNIATYDGWTALHLASERGHAEIVQALLACEEIDPNRANQFGDTPLQLASEEGHAEIIQALREALYPSPEEKGSTANRDNEKTRAKLTSQSRSSSSS